ncbi:MAG: glucose-6-phosphate isomerase [Nitrospinaceae bacterium]|nr:MAG: glucose-6-phosphate isomerase [Nitrospinaceae bacterium]
MTSLELNYENIAPFVTDQEIQSLQPRIDQLHGDLEKRTGKGSDFLGWMDLPSKTTKEQLGEIEQSAKHISAHSDVFVSIGIGGSYLGARAAISFLGHTFANQLTGGSHGSPEVHFAGHNLSSDYHADLFDLIAERDVCLNVISKSGTTTEPAVAFRLLKDKLEKKYGKSGAKKRIVVTTDREKGALKTLADEEGYTTFVIPDDVGGRYSVLTPVGLLPIAVAGVDIRELIEGAKTAEAAASANSSLEKNLSYLYAAIRHLLYSKGKTLEVLAAFHPSLAYILEWWKQLAGESEGKEHKGIFPASVEYTTDLHSMGQWVQEGNRILFETFLRVATSRRQLQVPAFENDDDGLNYLAGKTLDFVNDKAYKGTAMAHLEGEVPNMEITVKDRSPDALGQLFYFFERAIAMTGYLLDVDPFDQPGVEFYKKNMFQLLNKPGYGKG